MKYRSLGHNGIQVSPLCLGTMMFGGPTDEATSRRIADKAFDQGVNFIDTADRYCDGNSEQVVGHIIESRRDEWVLATKFANAQGTGPNDLGASRKYIMKAVEASLRRLGTDYIDLYYVHHEDPLTPIVEIVRALGDLVRDGKIRYYALSNHAAWRIAEFCKVADELGLPRPAASQPCYNLANRQPEVEELAACDYYGIGVVSYSPLARGILTAKYDATKPPPSDSRVGRKDKRIAVTEWRPESLEISQRIKQRAEQRGITPGQFAVAWVLNNRYITSVVAGPRTEEQWDQYVPALDYAFTQEDESFTDEMVAPGHASAPGYIDPRRPVEGRSPRSSELQPKTRA